MERYKNLGGQSGIVEYEIMVNGITIRFRDGWNYLYNTQSTSPDNIRQMQQFAVQGRGLNSFITRVVRRGFLRKWR